MTVKFRIYCIYYYFITNYLTRQSITSQPEALMLKSEDNIEDHFIYQHFYINDEIEATNQVSYIE